MVGVNIFLRPGRSHVWNWQKLVSQQNLSSVFEKIFQPSLYQTEWKTSMLNECMLFGLCNTPTAFQRLMQNCLGELSLTYSLIYFDDMIVFFLKWRSNICITCVLCLCSSGSTIWNMGQPGVNSSGIRWTIWLIMSPRGAFDLARRTWRLWLNSLHHKPTLQSEPFWAWLDIIDGLLKGLCALCNHCMGICLEKVSVRGMSMSHSWQTCWVPLRC